MPNAIPFERWQLKDRSNWLCRGDGLPPLVVLLLAFALVVGCSASDNWQTLYNAGVSAQERDPKQAIDLFKQSISVAESSANRKEELQSLLALAETLKNQMQYPEVAQVYEQAVELSRKDGQSQDLARLLGLQARAQNQTGDWDQAEKAAAEALAIYQHLGGAHLRDNAGAYAALADAKAKQRDFAAAIDCDKKALAIDEEVSGKDDAVVMQDLRRLADVLTRAERFDEADQTYKRLVRLNEKLWQKGNLMRKLALEEYVRMLDMAKRDEQVKIVKKLIDDEDSASLPENVLPQGDK